MTNILTDNNTNFNLYSPAEIAQKVATKAKEKRLSFNYTQEALSKKSGVSLGSLKRFESSYEISLQNLLLLAFALNSIDEFLSLFPENKYTSIDEVLKMKNQIKRKRGRNKD